MVATGENVTRTSRGVKWQEMEWTSLVVQIDPGDSRAASSGRSAGKRGRARSRTNPKMSLEKHKRIDRGGKFSKKINAGTDGNSTWRDTT